MCAGAWVFASCGSTVGRGEWSDHELPRPEHSVNLLLHFYIMNLCLQLKITPHLPSNLWKLWSLYVPNVFYFFFLLFCLHLHRKPLVSCVEKQLLGEHMTAILQKGEWCTLPVLWLCALVFFILFAWKVFPLFCCFMTLSESLLMETYSSRRVYD